MRDNFISVGWTRESRAMERQLEWLDQALSNNAGADYLIVAGHHPVAICKASSDIKKIVPIMKRYNTTAYLYGHRV
jgi:3',5'-cyclic AMP phosphodiesterase CpdA